MIPCQRHLFDIPEDVAYLNTAYMSPLLNSVVSAIDRGSRLKAKPWKLKISNFFELKLGRVTKSPTSAAKNKLTNDIQMVVQRPPSRNSMFDEPWG